MRDLAARAHASYETELGTVGAFLPERTPPDRLAPPFTRYGDACLELPRRHPAEFGGVRRWLDDEFGAVDPPAVSALVDLPRSQQDELMTVLSFLAHAYRWDTIPPAPERFAERQIALPAGIEEPWTELARLLDWIFARLEPGGTAVVVPQRRVPATRRSGSTCSTGSSSGGTRRASRMRSPAPSPARRGST